MSEGQKLNKNEKLGVFDYNSLHNIQANASKHDSIARESRDIEVKETKHD